MAVKKPVWGVDVGQCSLKALKLQQTGEGVEILAVDLVEHESILSQAEAEAPAMIDKAIETFRSRNDLGDSQIVVAVPGQQTLTRFTKMPPVDQKKIPDMVKYEASQQIPFDMDEVVWDYQIFISPDSPDIEVGIFAIRKELIRNHLAHFIEQGLEPIAVQTSPMASYNAAYYEWPPEPGKATLLLDMGALATDLIIFEGNRLWSRPVPIGGNRFTEALVSAFKISFSKAERLKRTAATSKYARQIFQAMRPVFADLVSEIQRSIGYYTSTHRDSHITRVLGMGNAFKLPGLQKFLQQNLQVDVDKASAFKKAATTLPPEKVGGFNENIMSFGVAYGLALQGLGQASVDASLLPAEVARLLVWRKKQPWFGAAAASLALAAGALWVGNVVAGGQLTRDCGNLSNIGPRPVPNTDAAMQIVQSALPGAPIEALAVVAGAADKLKQEYSQVAGASVGDQGALKRMSKLPERNVIIPRILDVIHRAFVEAEPEEVRVVKNSVEYQKLAKRIPRVERRELWITSIRMFYSPNDPEIHFGGKDGKTVVGTGKPGWAIQIVGVTTASKDEAAKFLDEKLIAQLEKFGREPKRGFHFGKVMLGNVDPRSEGAKTVDRSDFGSGEDGTRQQRPGEYGGRGTTRGPGTRRPSTGDGPTLAGPGGGSPGSGRGTSADGSGIAGALAKWKEKLGKQDPLTGEALDGDQQFTIKIVVYKGDTPKKDIPKEYADQQTGEGGKTGEKEPEKAPESGDQPSRPDQ